MQQAKTVTEFSTYAAEQFLRTAVFIDDRIYDNKTGIVNVPTTLQAPVRKKALKSSKEINPEESPLLPEEDNEDQDFSSQQLVNSFAKKQIVCSLYQPRRKASFSEDSDVYKFCLASDIVIVDWDIYGDDGKKTINLVVILVKQSLKDIPEQLRLILVYTDKENLFNIADQIYSALTTETDVKIVPQKDDEGLSMHTPNSRIVILGKKPGHRPDNYKNHEIAEKELAQRSIEEFSKLASGLLQGTVLLGLAKIRENSRKILSKFDRSLDPAFLTHRSMSLPDVEACEHVHPLLVAEIQSILQDCLSGQIISNNVIKSWVSEQWKSTDSARQLFGTDENAREFVEYFCLFGSKIKDKYQSSTFASSFVKKVINKTGWSSERENIRKLAELMESDVNSQSSHKLAILMSHRTSYGDIKKSLTLGTIIRKGVLDSSEYLLCLLPSCDTVRLSEKRRFVFCVLDVMNEGNETKAKANHVIEDEGKIRELLYTPKSFNCVTLEFEPDSETKRVMATKDENSNLSFICKSDDQRYKWIAQLKPDHAQRAAEQFARDLSRVGLTESEWLRLMSR